MKIKRGTPRTHRGRDKKFLLIITPPWKKSQASPKQTFPSSEFFHLSEILANSVVGLYTGVSFTRETGN